MSLSKEEMLELTCADDAASLAAKFGAKERKRPFVPGECRNHLGFDCNQQEGR